MKVGQERSAQTSVFLKRNLWWCVVLVLVFVLGLIAGSQEWPQVSRQVRSAWAWVVRSVAPAEELPTLVVDVGFANYNDLLAQREEALRTGVYVPSNRDFVTATVQLEGTVVPVRMRLAEGPAERLGEDDKWGLEIHTRDEQRLLDMQRFYLLDPAANNLLNGWAFARALEREGMLVAHYRLVRLIWNGAERGIYALQEGVAGDLLAAQGRPEGIIVGFDADLLWESMADFGGDARAAYADPVANLSATDFQYFEVEAFRDAATASDPNLSAQADAAVGLLRGLQGGEVAASEVFDVGGYGRFLALVDLWGATEATSLVNLHYYYNPTSARLEPIGFNARPLGSEARVSLAATYDDPVLQAAYVGEAARVSRAEYLDRLQAELEPEWERLRRALSAEYGELEPPWDELRRRQGQMRRSLDPVQPVFAALGSPTLAMSGTLRVEVGNVLNLPVEVVGFDIHGATVVEAKREWMAAESDGLLVDDGERVVLRAFDAARAPVIRYARFDIPLVEIHRLDEELDFMEEWDVQVVTRILGLSTTHLTLAQQ